MTSKCYIHRRETPSTQEIIEFNETSWTKCAAARQKHTSSKSSKVYKSIIANLPTTQPKSGGYHKRCYALFTSVTTAERSPTKKPPETTPKFPQPSQSKHAISPPIRSPRSSGIKVSNSGVLEEHKCFLCNAVYKRDGNGGWEKPSQVKAPSKEKELKELIHDDVILWGQYGDVNFIIKEVCYHNKYVSTYKHPSKREAQHCSQGV